MYLSDRYLVMYFTLKSIESKFYTATYRKLEEYDASPEFKD